VVKSNVAIVGPWVRFPAGAVADSYFTICGTWLIPFKFFCIARHGIRTPCYRTGTLKRRVVFRCGPWTAWNLELKTHNYYGTGTSSTGTSTTGTSSSTGTPLDFL
jgi:hypothetical protein